MHVERTKRQRQHKGQFTLKGHTPAKGIFSVQGSNPVAGGTSTMAVRRYSSNSFVSIRTLRAKGFSSILNVERSVSV